ncbi:MAG: glycosyl hydrolase 115 family protein [Burkholderiales bacterium]
MKIRTRFFVLVCELSLAATAMAVSAPAPASELVLPAGVPVFVAAGEHPALARAAADLARDLASVLGAPSPIVRERSAIAGRPAIVLTTQQHAQGAEATALLRDPESHAAWMQIESGQPRVVLTGAGTRGAIYAAYTFCDEILGIPPLAFWARWQPVRRSSLQIASDWYRSIPAPHVRWRAAFPNNTDFLRGWATTTGRDTDEILFETLLRLKMNTLDVGEALLDSSGLVHPRVLAASARGLAVTSPYLGSFRDWPQGVNHAPKDLLLSNVAGLEEFWSARVNALTQANIEMIWGIGFRGKTDAGFAEAFADAPTSPALQGQVVTQMLQRQLDLLRRLTGTARPLVRTEIYSELSRLYASGDFRPPEDADLIWNFANEGRDHYPGTDLLEHPAPAYRRGGYYMNLQFTSTGSHYAEGEGPWKTARNFAMAEERIGAPLQFTKVNVGNVREFLMNLSAHAALAWEGPRTQTDTVVTRIFARYFGSASGQVENLYGAMLGSYWQQRRSQLPGFERQFIFHDLRLGMAIERLLALIEGERTSSRPFDAERYRIVPGDSGAQTQFEALLRGTEQSAALRTTLLDQAQRARSTLAPERRPFFDDVITTPLALLVELDRAAAALAHAVMVAPPRFTPNSGAGAHLETAAAALERLKSHLANAERAPFQGWYSRLEILDVRALALRAGQASLRAGN